MNSLCRPAPGLLLALMFLFAPCAPGTASASPVPPAGFTSPDLARAEDRAIHDALARSTGIAAPGFEILRKGGGESIVFAADTLFLARVRGKRATLAQLSAPHDGTIERVELAGATGADAERLHLFLMSGMRRGILTDWYLLIDLRPARPFDPARDFQFLTGFQRDDEEGGNGLEAGVFVEAAHYAKAAGSSGGAETLTFHLRVKDYATGKVRAERQRFERRGGVFLPR